MHTLLKRWSTTLRRVSASGRGFEGSQDITQQDRTTLRVIIRASAHTAAGLQLSMSGPCEGMTLVHLCLG